MDIRLLVLSFFLSYRDTPARPLFTPFERKLLPNGVIFEIYKDNSDRAIFEAFVGGNDGGNARSVSLNLPRPASMRRSFFGDFLTIF